MVGDLEPKRGKNHIAVKFGSLICRSPPKSVPCLILSDYPSDDELALVVIVPHTTAVRNSRWEFPIAKPFLKSGGKLFP